MAAMAAGAASPAAAATQTECASAPATSALAPETFDALWTRSGPGWTGGDGARSVELPDGRVLWLFGDSFLGTVTPERTRSPDSPMVHNTFVVQDGACLTTHYGGTSSAPSAFVAPADASHWYWPASAVVESGELKVILNEYRPSGGGFLGFEHVRDVVATFSLPGLEPGSVEVLPDTQGTTWGSAILVDGDWTYVYGTEDVSGTEKYVRAARVPSGSIDAASEWRFFDGSGWDASFPSASGRVVSGVTDGVLRTADGYVLIAQGHYYFPTREIYAHHSDSPTGPWEDRHRIATIPDHGENLYYYAAMPHPEFSEGGMLLIGYSINSFQGSDLYSKADSYRPRFLSVPIPVRPAEDSTAPETTIDAGPSGVTSSASAAFRFSSEPEASFECKLDGAAEWTACSSPEEYSALDEGEHRFEVRALDWAGNADQSPASRIWTVDAVPPETSITSGPSGVATSTTASFSFSSSEDGSSFECRLDAGVWESCAPGETYSRLGLGAHTFYVRARDAVGKEDESPASRSWTIGPPPELEAADTTPPDGSARARRRQSLRSLRRRGVGVVMRTSEAGEAIMALRITRKTARRLGRAAARRRLVIGRKKVAFAEPDRRAVRVRPRRKWRRALRGTRRLRIQVRIAIKDEAGNRTVLTRRLTIKR